MLFCRLLLIGLVSMGIAEPLENTVKEVEVVASSDGGFWNC